MIDITVQMVTESGPHSVTLRALGSRAGVSHTAALHHFRSVAGLFSEVAADGFVLLADTLRALEDADALDAGVGYVRFAMEYPGYFDLMFNPALLDTTRPRFISARDEAMAILRRQVDAIESPDIAADAAAAVVAGWSLMHGLAVLARNGSLRDSHLYGNPTEEQMLALARRAGSMLFGSGPAAGSTT